MTCNTNDPGTVPPEMAISAVKALVLLSDKQLRESKQADGIAVWLFPIRTPLQTCTYSN